jgi:hypothetical protein
MVYPTLTSMKQTSEIRRYIRELWTKDRAMFFAAVSEYVVFFGFMLVVFLLDWRKALLFYLVPQQIALFVIQMLTLCSRPSCCTVRRGRFPRPGSRLRGHRRRLRSCLKPRGSRPDHCGGPTGLSGR